MLGAGRELFSTRRESFRGVGGYCLFGVDFLALRESNDFTILNYQNVGNRLISMKISTARNRNLEKCRRQIN